MELQTKQIRENFELKNTKEHFGPGTSENGHKVAKKPEWVTGHMYVSATTPEDDYKNDSCNDFQYSNKKPTKILIPGGNAGNDDVFMQVDPKTAGRFCLPPTSLENNVYNNPKYVSNNQRLANASVGTYEKYQNPISRNIKERTNVNPIITRPAFDSEWATNSFVSPPQINTQTNVEVFNSGYLSNKTDCDATTCPCEISKDNSICECDLNKQDVSENVVEEPVAPETITGEIVPGQTVEITPQAVERYSYPYKTEGKCTAGCSTSSCDCTDCNRNEYELQPPKPDDMVNSMGYFPEQVLNNNLPSNIAVGECQKSEEFNEYNKRIFTNILQPGVYARSEVVEPISANLGISTPLQFENIDKIGRAHV